MNKWKVVFADDSLTAINRIRQKTSPTIIRNIIMVYNFIDTHTHCKTNDNIYK